MKHARIGERRSTRQGVWPALIVPALDKDGVEQVVVVKATFSLRRGGELAVAHRRSRSSR
ncbi:MAG: hypothetical protein ABI193_02865 [Minicystis sp.]